jgi:hypothetical protein
MANARDTDIPVKWLKNPPKPKGPNLEPQARLAAAAGLRALSDLRL